MMQRNLTGNDLGRMVSQCAILAFVYFVTGVLSLQLIESPFTMGSPLWPAAGIALAALFIWGLRLWPGVFLGTVFVQLFMAYQIDHDISLMDKFVALGLGVGAVLQSVFGVIILRKVLGSTIPVIKGRDIGLFVMLVGPGISVLNATWSVIFLMICGIITPSAVMVNWFTWWLGDSIGTLIVFTGLLTLWGLPRDVWRSRRLSVGVTSILLLVTLVGYFAIVRKMERDRIGNNLNYLVPLAHTSLKGWFTNASIALKSWRGHYEEILEDPLWEKSKNYRDQFLNYHDTVHGMGIAVLVRDSDREKFEANLRTPGNQSLSIFERNETGLLVKAEVRNQYACVVSYTSRADTEVPLIGYDLFSNSQQKQAIEKAVESNSGVACPFTSPFDLANRHVMLMVLPYFEPKMPIQTPVEREKALRGIAFVIYDLDAITSRALQSQIFPTRHLMVSLSAASEHHGEKELETLHWTRNKANISLPIDVGMVPFHANYEVESDFMKHDYGKYLDLMRFFWLLITILVVSMQLLISGRIFAVEGEVQQRTADLRNEIAERIRVESKLRTVQASLEEAESQAQVGSWERDLKSNQLWFSPEHYRIIGRDPESGPPNFDELLKQVHPDDLENIRDVRTRVLASGQPESMEVRTHPDQGPIRYLNTTMRVINDSNGQPARVAGTVQNITQRKLMEQDLRQARDELELRVRERTHELVVANEALRNEIREREIVEAQFRQAQKMEILGQLAGGVAHDFNNLLTVICGYAEMLCENPALDTMTKEWVGEIFNTGQRAALLTRQLLAFSRKHVLEPKTININEIVRDIEKLSLRLVGENIQFRLNLDPAPMCVRGDPSQMEQILLNLAVNSRDAMPNGGTITVETASVNITDDNLSKYPVNKPGAYVVLSLADTGCGMSPEVQARIFEPFFTTKDPGKGTGLGLATVFGIVKQSDGAIGVCSEVGKGTTFFIYMPQKFADSISSKSGLTKILPTGNETILIAEDEESVQLLARQILESCGYKVLTASDGLMALQLATQHDGPIDLLISDIVMPNLSGRELLSRMREARPNLKVMLFSGYADDESIRDEIVAEEIPFLNKPFTVSQLAQKVRVVIDQKS